MTLRGGSRERDSYKVRKNDKFSMLVLLIRFLHNVMYGLCISLIMRLFALLDEGLCCWVVTKGHGSALGSGQTVLARPGLPFVERICDT